MANSYVPGKWNGTIRAKLDGDASKTTATLDVDFDTELANLKKVQKNVNSKIKDIKAQITALKNHKETGKFATDYLKNTEKRLDKIHNEMDAAINTLSKEVGNAQKEEWARIKKIVAEWEAQQANNV